MSVFARFARSSSVNRRLGSRSPRLGVITNTPEFSPCGGRANASAYANLPRKYRPDRNVNISPMDAPAAECRARATGNIVAGLNRRCERLPSRRAGDSRKMRGGEDGIDDLEADSHATPIVAGGDV